MLVNKAYKFRIYPNTAQKVLLGRQFGCVRFVYNHFLDLRIKTYESTGVGLSYNKTANILTELKNELVWLKESDSQVLQSSLADLDTAYSNFFQGRAKFPNFKSKRGKQSCRYPQRFKFSATKTYLPKIGWVKTIFHRQLTGTPKNLTVSKTKTGKYFISVCVEEDIAQYQPVDKSVGIDLGLKDFIVTSDGDKVAFPKFLRRSEKKLKKLQKSHSKKSKGGKNREKARIKLARQHEKVANQRKDFQHKISRNLVDTYDFIALEDLNIKGMVKNHKLAKSISDASWGQFVRFISYKGNWYGSTSAKAARFYPSSKRHYGCGWIKEDLALKDRVWVCGGCGEYVDRDTNAAKNILYTVGNTEINAWGDGSVESSLNQEAN
jgi:putative transposase